MRSPLALAAGLILAPLIFCALFGLWLVPYDPIATQAGMALHPPSAAHWFGTDQLGRDVFSRVVVAARLDLGIAFVAVLLSLALGAVLGAAMGYFQGWLDAVAGRVTDVLMAFPLFMLAMVLVGALGPSATAVVCATAAVNLPFYIRLARAEASIRRHLGYVEAARVGGSGHGRILRVFLLPNILPPLLVQASVNLGWAVLNTAGLSFLGLGIRAPAPEWGIMVAEGAQFVISGRWWIAAFPGLALMLAVLGFNLLGDALREVVDPRRRG
ncbi:ABC transporter permease subunit [Pseudoroseomonas wenyumeiae]|uniref:ABC transporter permease n=1 Tax=Teichococcus wenyumeiae TaxID=2478470 RepID=A0A3A9JV99_9PROT|nr:ABC transporter permease [Pseudoroseomonas wenyumeiae]RKK02939.1 ABC transporter permease [Pseudoroseomonas wenyumeiae]RMI24526.1 ABC transporter permease subunit [Pseudoroseomonas wenyumeiae]